MHLWERKKLFYISVFVVLTQLLSDVGADVVLTDRPLNVAGVRGITQSLALPCEMKENSDPEVNISSYTWHITDERWPWNDDDDEVDVVIFDKAEKNEQQTYPEYYSLVYPVDDPYLDKQWKRYGLTVQTTTLAVSGRYRCSGSIPGQEQTEDNNAYADILLLDQQPRCQARDDQDQIVQDYVIGDTAHITCEVTYSGRWPPLMEFTNTDQEQQETQYGNYARGVFSIPDLKPLNNGYTYVCTARFDAPSNPEEWDATNAPVIDSVESCSVELVVLYPPQDVRIKEDTATVGGTLTCVADANPEVSSLDYEWTVKKEDGQTSTDTGLMLTLLPEHEGSREIKCCATNVYREEPHPVCSDMKTFDVMEPTEPPPTTNPTTEAVTTGGASGKGTTILLGIISSVVVILLVLL